MRIKLIRIRNASEKKFNKAVLNESKKQKNKVVKNSIFITIFPKCMYPLR